MIMLLRSKERHHDRRKNQEAWHTFHSKDKSDALAKSFGTLELLNEDRLPPGARIPHQAHHDAEIVTYVREGTLAYEDSMGHSGIIYAGEFQRMTVVRGLRHSETNASRIDGAHVFQIGLRLSEGGLEPGHEEKRFCAAERRGIFCIVASPDGRKGSLRIHQEALMYSAMLEPGLHLVHELSEGRSAWLHLLQGQVMLGDVQLTTGDGIGATAERAISLTAQERSELLLLDLGEHVSKFSRMEMSHEQP
jgi:quercetin 2,3-dioxygenase